MMQHAQNLLSEAFSSCFPFWNELAEEDIDYILVHSKRLTVPKGTNIYNSNEAYNGIFLIREGALRCFLVSDDGRDVTLYRLLEGEIGALSSNGVFHDVILDLNIQAERDCVFYFIPACVFKKMSEKYVMIQLFISQLTISRYSEILWTLQSVLFISFDRRLATFLYDEMVRTGSDTISLTHELIASYTGSVREVVSRMLKYFATEGIIETGRGSVRILDRKRLRAIAG